ncbi:MAG: hypothetical protein GX207_05750 [Peptococcaceae bacterium]|nr:hypothetical protein [Peptococcaceae bacterium]NLP45395.1 hypothetical protein [Peptococcaceae bacterium]
MFKTDKDRLNYGSILMPPVGYKLEKAVGTTYSLDLEALTAVAITLGLHEEIDTELDKNPICLLNAIEKISDKILLFCEAGQIKLPKTPSTLCFLLEKMVVPVALAKKSRKGRYPSFHPKTWVLQYSNDKKERKYRFIVLSRNLTFDRSWDVSLVLDSNEQAKQQEKTQPIIEFLMFLRKQISGDYSSDHHKKNLIGRLANELKDVSFDLNRKEFYDFEVLPLGIGNNQYNMSNDTLFRDTFHELVVMSPFLSPNVIEELNKDKRGLTGCSRTLITRKTELGKLKQAQVSNFDIYTLKDVIIDGEDALSDQDTDKQKQDIHAKIYLKRKYSDTDLYLGSMNATNAAINENVELMVRLAAKNRYLNGSIFLNDIFGGNADGPQNPFEKIEMDNKAVITDDDKKDQKEQVIKQICRMKKEAIIVKKEEKYDLTIDFEEEGNWLAEVLISPLRSKKKASFSSKIKFYDLDILQLSEFYSLKVSDDEGEVERILMIPTKGLPAERESAVVKSIIKDKKTFLEYIAFVLGDDYLFSYLKNKRINESGFFRKSEDIGLAIYEKMLKTSLDEPERLNDISYIMDLISDREIIPDEFCGMYEMFRKTLRL